MSNFCEMAPERLFEKNSKLLKYEHIYYVCHFKALGLEISNIYIFEIYIFRIYFEYIYIEIYIYFEYISNIQISRKYEQEQISRNFLKCS